MKYNVLFLGIATAMLASCTIQEDDFQTPVRDDDVKFYATFEQPAETGTKVFATPELYLRWDADDRVSIFNKNTYNQQYRFLGESGANAGEFAKVESAEFVTGNAIEHVVSVYPYSPETVITEEELVTMPFPREQIFRRGSFGPGACPMVSVSDDNVLQFKNLCGFLTFSFYGEGMVNSVTLQGNNDEKLWGTGIFSLYPDRDPYLWVASDVIPSDLVLTCQSPVSMGTSEETAREFWFVVPPMTFKQGFTVTVNTSAGTFKRSTSKSVTIERNRISRMAPAKLEISTAPEIVFEDPAVKAVCLDKWDFDCDGKFTYEEAAQVTDLGAFFSRNNDIVKFNELEYFTGLTEIAEQAFLYCENLTSVKLPETVTVIHTSAFGGCKSLTSINLPRFLTTVESSAFGHTNLASIEIPASLTEIGQNAFNYIPHVTSIVVDEANPVFDSRDGCNAIIDTETNELIQGCANTVVPRTVAVFRDYAFAGIAGMTTYEIPSWVTTIGGYVFGECPDLTSMTIPAGVESIGLGLFRVCDKLTSIVVDPANPVYDSREGCNAIIVTETNTLRAVCRTTVIPDSVTAIDQATYGDNKFLPTDFVVPDNVTFIGQVAFTGTNIESMTLPAGLKQMGILPISFNTSLNTLVCYAPEPPECLYAQWIWPFQGNGPDFKIYVPAESVEDYKAAVGWDHYADVIFPIQ